MAGRTAWFLTDTGRKVCNAGVLVLSAGSFAAYVAQHTVFLDKYKDLVQMYSMGVEKPLKKEIKERAEKVLAECKLTDRESSLARFFTVFGFDTFHAGSMYTKMGTIIGLPNHFNYNSKEEIDHSKIQIYNNSEPKWTSAAGQELLDSLILSENAQKFAIAREIHYGTTSYIYVYGGLFSISISSSYCLGSALSSKYRIRLARMPIRLMLYTLCGLLGFGVFITLKDSVTLYWDKYADKMAALTGNGYIEGGIEYYQKVLQRNRALRHLMGDYGKKVYTTTGNDELLLRMPHLPYTNRLDFLHQLKADKKLAEEQ